MFRVLLWTGFWLCAFFAMANLFFLCLGYWLNGIVFVLDAVFAAVAWIVLRDK